MIEGSPQAPDETAAVIPLARRPDMTLESVIIRPSLRTLEGPLGTARGEPRVIEVLLALADARGSVLSRDDLLRLCWGGRIVGDDAINRAVAEVRRICARVGAPFQIETVARVGYRIDGVDWNVRPDAASPASIPGISRRGAIAAVTLAGAVAVAGTGAVWLRRRGAVDGLIERGRLLQGSGMPGDLARAEAQFRKAIAQAPERADAWGWLATVLIDPGRAREAAQHALALDPRDPNARAVMAYQARDLGSWVQFEQALLEILKQFPDNAQALNHLTFFYQGMGRCRDSWNTNERANLAEPFNPIPLYRRATKHWIYGRVGEADKVADQAMLLWPHNPGVWNARMIIYAFTGRAAAGLAHLDNVATRPANLTGPSIASWRAALGAIATRAPADIARAVAICTEAAALAPGLAANAIMAFSYLGELDAAYRVASGLFESRGSVVQKGGSGAIRDVYAEPAWGRTQFLFIPATKAFRADARFPALCRQMGHMAYWQERGIWPDPFVRGALKPTNQG